ncbi:MAG: AbrB/MazE/SpoVT family DNA-binding domain-containing protein [bacterium]|nr:AbrB/MazE/SpoVT family DNA-binding domain-containing protein [bacterium]
MPTSTLTSKGQITIPKQVRDRLGVHQGDRIEFVLEPSGPVSLRPLKRSARDLAGFLHRPGAGTVSQPEMDAGVLELIAEDDERIREGG